MEEKAEGLSLLLDRVVWGIRIVEINLNDTLEVFAFRPLTSEERVAANFIKRHAMVRALRDGKPTKDSLSLDAQQRGIWGSQHEDLVKALQQNLLDTRKELEEVEQKDKNPGKGKRRIIINASRKEREGSSKSKLLKRRITNMEMQLGELIALQTKLIEMPSAEYQADQEHAAYIVQCATLEFPSMKQVWPRYQDIQNDTNTELILKLIYAYTNYSSVNTKEIRELARNGMWRIRWLTAKSCGSFDTLFNTPLSDLTPDQMMLLHWSQVYDSVYESIERPPDYVVEDDEELDKWLDRQIKDQEQERRKNFQSKKGNRGIGKASELNADEVMRPVDGFWCEQCTCGAAEQRGVRHAPSCPYGTYFYYKDQDRVEEEVERVQSANPDQVRMVLAREQQRLTGKGWQREEHLRDNMARKVLGLKTTMHKPGERPI